ncbi:GDSL-type esterase/lipase family protein [Pontibacter harenae]|uniref:GDSL-type esterase/lipase family protein n=1 Tax=Pontibacter harenae TaxID=2894083 RepID=UPI001E2B5A58|nr:GDSL-type esterase/lipase family protein [Pontibacter harenae]MCC9167654.1 GDSL-type esterase/lipase family protein [Pontibacter harenae]
MKSQTKKYLLLILFFCATFTSGFSQASRPFEEEIKNFEQQDKTNPPQKGAILFIGSSSIRMWKDLQERFEGYALANRGFGGSTLADVNYYADRILFPYRPSKIFLYAGENDLAGDATVEQTYQEFLKFYKEVTARLPETKVYFISAKPSPSRLSSKAKFVEFNNKVKTFINDQKCDWTYIDVYNAMLNANGAPRKELFIEDNLHMNSKGYDIWQEIVGKYL